MTTEEIAFIEDEQKKAKGWMELSKIGRIASLCNEHDCSDEKRKKHEWLFLHQQWNPHPSERFKRWWENQGWRETEEATKRGWSFIGKDGEHHAINTVTAYNCDAVRDVYDAFRARQDDELIRLKGGTPARRSPVQRELVDDDVDDEGIPF